VSDYDAANGVLSITKARVCGIDRDRTKSAEDRRVALCDRARSVLEQLIQRGKNVDVGALTSSSSPADNHRCGFASLRRKPPQRLSSHHVLDHALTKWCHGKSPLQDESTARAAAASLQRSSTGIDTQADAVHHRSEEEPNSRWETLCESQHDSGYSVNGTFAEYTIGAAANVGRLPERPDFAQMAPILCAGLTEIRT
jgi:hypothetical protein